MRRLLLILCAVTISAGAAAEERPVDLELVLAVDNSLSVNQREFALQVSGIAQAFDDPGVIDAIRSTRGIAVALVLWSNHKQQSIGVEWSYLRDAGSIQAFAEKVAAVSRLPVSGGTGIGSAMAYALRLFPANGYRGARRVIDVSGDGQNNMGVGPEIVRDRAVALGVTVNGLAILDEEPQLDRYYVANVIGGAGAFLEIAKDFDTFSEAMRRKLRREIGTRPVAFR